MPRTYKSINISEEQQRFIRLLDDFEIEIFNLTEIESLVGVKFQNLNIILENLASKKVLTRIERGRYCRSNFRNENVIGRFLAKNGTISYWSALNKHGITSRFPNSIFIQTAFKKKEKIVQGASYKFIWVSPGKMTGIITEGYGNNAFRITDVEVAMIDRFDLPRFFRRSRGTFACICQYKPSGEKLIEYSKAVHNKAALKRMGFIAELLDKKGMKSFIRYAKSELNKSDHVLIPRVNVLVNH